MLSQTIETFFPINKNAFKISIGHLLNHRSGIFSFTNNPEYLAYNTKPKSENEMVAIITTGKSIFCSIAKQIIATIIMFCKATFLKKFIKSHSNLF